MNKQLIKKSRIIEVVLKGVKLAIFLVIVVFIYFKIQDPDKFGDNFYAQINFLVSNNNSLFLMGIAIFLMPMNWLLEAAKWKKLLSIKQDVSIISALKGVISGLSIGFATPQAVGDYAGRIWHLSGKNRSVFIGSIWLGNALQMGTTMLFAIVGVIIFYQNSDASFPFQKVLFTVLFLTILGVGLVFFLKKKWRNWIGKFQQYFIVITDYSIHDILVVFALALLRYVVFSLQFVLVLIALEVKLPLFQLFGGVSWVFLFKSIIPSFNFMSDLGVRELSALTYFDLFQMNQSAVVVASLLIWLINILMPVIFGLYFVFQMKISESK